jgi:diguanylate cyclase (GGDEF)-like protein/PAS domain S-box-containing protein
VTTPASKTAGSAAPEAPVEFDAALTSSLLTLAKVSLGVPAELQVLGLADIDRMRAATSGATAQLGNLCHRAIAECGPVIVADLPRVAERPGAWAGMKRMFAGFPLLTADASICGALCATTDRAQGFSPHDLKVLAVAADNAAQLLDSDARLTEAQQQNARLRAGLRETERALTQSCDIIEQAGVLRDRVLGMLGTGVIVTDASGRVTLHSSAAVGLLGQDPATPPDSWPVRANLFERDGSTPLAPDRWPSRRVLSTGPVDNELISVAGDAGSIRLVRYSGWQSHNSAGELSGSVVMLSDVTEQTRIAEALEQANTDLTTVLDSMRRDVTLATVVPAGPDGPSHLRVEWGNKHLLDRLGTSLDSVTGRTFAQAYPQVVAGGYEQRYLEIAASGKQDTFEVDWFEGIAIAGAFEVTVTPWGQDGLLIESTDTTARRQAQHALQRSQRMLSESQSIAKVGSWDADFGTGIMTWSEVTYEIMGLDPALPAPSTIEYRRLIHPEDAGVYTELMTAAARGGRHEGEYRVRRPDGSIRHIRAWLEVVVDDQGNRVRAVGTVMDQTERYVSDLELARSRELEHLVIDRSPIGIALLDRDGRYVQVNNAMCSMIGRTREELLTLGVADITDVKDREGIANSLDALYEGRREAVAHDLRYVHSNGRPLWVSEHKTLLRPSTDEQASRVLVQVIDISERQQRADELSRQARTDALTSLANRRGWEPRLASSLAEAKLRGTPLTVAILDLDRFKNFNDTYGHPVGDQLLVETSAAWRAHLIRAAPRALLARLGGEEFGVLLPNTDLELARRILAAMIRRVARDQTASAGLTTATDTDDEHVLMARADAALYLAKNNGRARVEVLSAD